MQMVCNWNSRAGHSLTTALLPLCNQAELVRDGELHRRDDLKTKTKADIPCYLWSCQKKSYQRQTGELATWSTGPSLGPPCREHTRWHWTSRLWLPMTHSLAPGTYTPGMPQRNTAICVTPQIQIWSTSFLAVGQRCCIAGSVGGMGKRLCKLAEILDARILLTGI